MGKISVRGVLSGFFILTLTSLILGCGKNKEEAAPPPPTPAQTSAPVPASPEPPPPAPAPPTSGPPAQSAATLGAGTPPAPAQTTSASLVSTEGDMPGVTLSILELKRTSNALNLKMLYVNRTSKIVDMVWLAGDRNLSGVHLLDMAGKKKYFVVTDSEGHCVCSTVSGIDPQTQLPVWAKFPPVPDNVRKITVEVPHFPPLDDVPVSQ